MNILDVVVVVGALAALVGAAAGLFAAWQSTANGRAIAEIRGSLATTTDLLRDHVNTPGLHLGR